MIEYLSNQLQVDLYLQNLSQLANISPALAPIFPFQRKCKYKQIYFIQSIDKQTTSGYPSILVPQLIASNNTDIHMDNNRLVSPSAANRLIGEVVQSQRRPLLGPSPG